MNNGCAINAYAYVCPPEYKIVHITFPRAMCMGEANKIKSCQGKMHNVNMSSINK